MSIDLAFKTGSAAKLFAAFRLSQIETGQDQCQVLGAHRKARGVVRCLVEDREAAALEALAEKPVTARVKAEDLREVTPAIEENEDVAVT